MSQFRRLDEGVAAVEFALIAPILVLLLVGIIDFGGIYGDHIAVRQGSREGARQLILGNGASSSYLSGCALDTGDFAGGAQSPVDRQVFCMVKDRVGLDNPDTRVAIRFEAGVHAEGRSVTVCVAYPAKSITGFFRSVLTTGGRTVRSSTQARVQALYGAADTPLTGDLEEDFPYPSGSTPAERDDDWSWCNADTTT